MRARFLEPAEAEVDQAVAYFDSQRPGLGERFERDLLETVTFVATHPHTGKRLSENVRKFPLRTFRYNIIYAVDDGEVIIIAVGHHRRRPGYWRARLMMIR